MWDNKQSYQVDQQAAFHILDLGHANDTWSVTISFIRLQFYNFP